MQTENVLLEPWLSPVVEWPGRRYVVDLKLGHFRELASPYETVEFDSFQGRELGSAMGMVICDRCVTSFVAPKPTAVSHCAGCDEPTGAVDPETVVCRLSELAGGEDNGAD